MKCTCCTLQTIKEDGAQQISLNVGTYLMTELAKLRDKYEIIGDVRGKGLQIGVEMVKDKVFICNRNGVRLDSRARTTCVQAEAARGNVQ